VCHEGVFRAEADDSSSVIVSKSRSPVETPARPPVRAWSRWSSRCVVHSDGDTTARRLSVSLEAARISASERCLTV